MQYLLLDVGENIIQNEILLKLATLAIIICRDTMLIGLRKFRRKKEKYLSWIGISLVKFFKNQSSIPSDPVLVL